MPAINENHYSTMQDPAWYFLSESPLCELLVAANTRDDLPDAALFQALRALGVPPQRLCDIRIAVLEFARHTIAHFDQGKTVPPVNIRLFCQKKALEDQKPFKSSPRWTAGHPLEPQPILHHSAAGSNGGWGYFMVERNGRLLAASSQMSQVWVDLYLYKEGE